MLLIMAALVLWSLIPPGPAQADGEETTPPPASPQEPLRVRAVNFKGFDNLSPSEAAKVLEIRPPSLLGLRTWPLYDKLKVARDEQRLVELYHEYGFFQAKVKAAVKIDQRSRSVVITFTAHEENPVKIKEVRLIFPDPAARQRWEAEVRKVLPLKPGQRFTLEAYQQAKAELGRLLSNQAHPLHEVDGQVLVQPDLETAVIRFKVKPGPRLLFGSTSLLGNHHISARFILRELAYIRGQPFSLKALELTQKRLMDTGFFTYVALEPQYNDRHGLEVPINLRVNERPPHSIRLGLGYGTEDLFRLRLLQVNRDPLGRGDTLILEGKLSAIYEGMVARWKFPYLLGARGNLILRGGLEQTNNEAYINRRRFFRPIAEFLSSGHWSWYAGLNLEVDRMWELKSQVPDPDFEKQAFFIVSVPVGLKYDSRNSILNPTSGTLFYLDLEISTSLLGSELEYLRPVASISRVQPIPRFTGWFLAMRARAGLAIPIKEERRIPLVRRFFAGGADSVRGFPYQKLGPLDPTAKPLGGEAMLEGNLELRFPIWKELGGVVFVDAGNVYEDIGDNMGALRFTSGAGLRYQTPVGPLRLDFGYQLNPPGNAEIPRYQVYLSVGQAF